MDYPEQYGDTELNPPPGDGLDMDCRGGNHRGCTGPPGTRCGCSCHVTPAVYPRCTPWTGTGRFIYSDTEREAVNGFPCPLCAAKAGEPCTAGSEFEAAVVHVARLSLVSRRQEWHP